MKCIVLVIFALCVQYSSGLYEDQVGKFEWRQQYLGKAIFSNLDIISPVKKILVGTEENVVAAIGLKSGDIVWRQILEKGNDGRIVFMHVDNEVVTISGSRNPVVRGWELENGHSLFEWPVGPLYAQNYAKWVVIDDSLILLQFPHGELVGQWFNLRTGSSLGSKRMAVDIEDASKCIQQGSNIACLESDSTLVVIAIREAGNMDVKLKKLGPGVFRGLTAIDGKLPIVSAVENSEKRAIIKIVPEIEILNLKIDADFLLSSAVTDQQEFIFTSRVVKNNLEVKTYNMDGKEDPTLRSSTAYPETLASPESVATVCQQRRDGSVACRLLLTAKDHTLALLQHPGGFLWTRHEALASILGVEIVDLPVSETDAAIEKEFSNKETGFVGMFVRRLCNHFIQLQNLLLTILGVPLDNYSASTGLVRDDFGLHKLIVVVTKPGKIFGIDNLSGEIVWQLLTTLKPYGEKYGLFVMRTPIHIPHSAQMAILGRNSNGNGVLLVLNPITGNLVEPVIELSYSVQQATLLQITTENFLKPLLLLDTTGKVHVYPSTAKGVAHSVVASTFLYTVDTNKGIVDGYELKVVDGEIQARRSWRLNLGLDDAKIVVVAAKRDTERVHSQGRVMIDRSVLYKYVNPNLVAIFTQGYHPVHKTILNVYLVDVVSGLIVYSASHRRAREPIHAVHSENWLVYSYMSDKHRRTEMATLEFYEGATQANATAFTSLMSTPLMPIVEKQAYILPAHVIALRDTVTEKGITNKHIMVALSSGGILELPWAYLDPRRTMMVTQEMREEGVVPYMPELPIPSEAIVNHNRSVSEVRGIYTAPSGLESTSLLFVYGLDILYTRVAPSKTFDLLKEDFDYFIITAMMTGLILASLITRKLASRKAVKQAWK